MNAVSSPVGRASLLGLVLFLLAALPAEAQNFRKGYSAYLRGDYAAAIAEWQPLADQGYVKAQNNLGTMYSQGKGVSRNYELAAFWYRRAAAQGDARAFYNLGIAYEHGRGVDQDDRTALDWYRRAAVQNVVQAMNAVAWIYATSPDPGVRDGRQAIRWAESALTRRTSAKHLSTLAAAYAEAGEFAKAVAAIERAIDAFDRELSGVGTRETERDLFLLARREGRTDEAVTLLERLEFFRSGQPVRD